MKPVEIPMHERQMMPLNENGIIGASQPEYLPLPVVRWLDPEGRVITRWELTEEERQRLIAGEHLYIAQCTFGQRLQPILPTVGVLGQLPAHHDQSHSNGSQPN